MRPLILQTRCQQTDSRKTVSKHVWRAAEKLRAEGLVVGHLKAFIETKRFGAHCTTPHGGAICRWHGRKIGTWRMRKL